MASRMPEYRCQKPTLKWILLRATGSALLALGCSQQPPVAAPSGDQASYAERYPTKLTGVRAAYAKDESEARGAISKLRALPDSLKGADYAHVKGMVERADAAGRSASYAEVALEGESIRRFLEEEKGPLHRKVAGGVNYAAKQKNCTEDLGGQAVVAMERGIEKQLEERTRAQSDAHRYIEEYQDELGHANLVILDHHADRLTRTSHIVHVRLELYRRELKDLLAEASSAKSTLDRVLRESEQTLADAKASKTKKSVAEHRKKLAQQARNRIEIDVEQALRAEGEMEVRIQGVQKEYDVALDQLIEALEQRAAQK